MSIIKRIATMPIVHQKQEKPFVKKHTMIIITPSTINEIPPKRWLFFHVVSFFILHTVLSPAIEFIRSFGIILPNIIIATPGSPNKN